MSQKLLLTLCILAFVLLCFLCLNSHEHEGAAQSPAASQPPTPAVVGGARIDGRIESGRVILNGTVPDASVKTSLVDRARSLYGPANVQDDIKVEGSGSSPSWGANVGNLVSLLGGRVSDGSFSLTPDSITLRGEVAGDDVKASIVRAATDAVGSNLRVIDELRVVAKSEAQTKIDDLLKGKIIEFATGSAEITPRGRATLDEVIPFLKQAGGKKVEIGGHTDNEGDAGFNQRLSNDRAFAVQKYLAGKGLPAAQFTAIGYGAARPVADNATPEGRQRNRRIEFAIQ